MMFKNEAKKGLVVIPLLVGLGIVAVVLGVLVIGGKRNEEGQFKMPFIQEKENSSTFEGAQGITVLPTQKIITNKKIFLTVSSPADGTIFSQNSIKVTGQTLPGAEVSINEKELVAGADGRFSATISLEEGENPILITAGNESGFEEKEITVSYEK